MTLETLKSLCDYYQKTTQIYSTETHSKAKKYTPGRSSIRIEDVPEEYQDFAQTITPETLDLADFQYALTNLTIGRSAESYSEETLQNIESLRSVLGYPKSDPEGVTLEFTTVNTQHGVIGSVRLTPSNYDASLEPVVFVGGLNHMSSVYLDFLTQTAIASGRRIIAFDTPGVGTSVVTDSVTHKILADSLVTVLDKLIPKNQSVIVMAHSLGTVALRDLLYHKEVNHDSAVKNQILKYVFIAPVPWGKDQRKGLRFSNSYIADGVVSMLSHTNHLVAKESDGGKRYFAVHDKNEIADLNAITATQAFPIGPIAFLSSLFMIAKQPLWDQMNNPKVKVVLAEHDQIFKLKKQNDWQDRGAIVLEQADHSAIAGKNVNAQWVAQIVESLK